MENLKNKIADCIELTVIHKSKSLGDPDLYLIGILPASIEWQNGKTERIELIENIKVARFPQLKMFLGARIERIKIKNELQESWIRELINKATAGLERIIKSKQLYGQAFKKLTIK